MKPMKTHNSKTGRKMGNGPIFTDGSSLYIVSQRKDVKSKDGNESDESVAPSFAIVIEQYSPNDGWKHKKSTTLLKNDQGDIFNQKSNPDVDAYLKSATFHTNGDHLLLCHQTKRHLFNLSTGVRVEKKKADEFSALVIHDLQNNCFYGF